jgi:hypothetical protein
MLKIRLGYCLWKKIISSVGRFKILGQIMGYLDRGLEFS